MQDARHLDDPGAPQPALQAEEIRVACRAYFSVPAAVESDHKPVLASLAVSMPVTDQVTAAARLGTGSQTSKPSCLTQQRHA